MEFVSDKNRPYVDSVILQRAIEYVRKYGNEKIVRRTLPTNEIPQGVVGFTFANPKIPEFFTVPDEHMPYLNGIHAGKAVALHEEMHIRIAEQGGEQNEKAINNYVAAKLGYAVFPFPSY
jgi:hypothetical protein